MKYSKKGAIVVGGLASMMMIGSTAAYAAHTVVTVGGVGTAASVPVTGDNLDDVTFDTNFGVPMTCESSAVNGTVERGASVDVGNVVGSISSLTLSDCTATALEYDVIATMSAQDITVRTHPANAGDPVEVDIAVDASVVDTGSGNACNFDAEGSVRAEIQPGDANADGYIVLQNGYDLEITRAGSGGMSCGGEIYEGDLAQATGGTFALTTSGPNAGAINHG